MNSISGELAALATSLFFTATSTIFTLAGRQVGSIVLNRVRLLFAFLLLAAAHLVIRLPLPFGASPERWFWLSLSGVAGLAFGDMFLFQAFIWIGPRLTMLMMSLAPVLASLLAWLFLAETLTAWQVTGILVTISGVAWVVLDRNRQTSVERAETRKNWMGVLFGLGAATGQAVGLVTAKVGLGVDFPALSGTLIRMLAAAAVLWGITFLRGKAAETFQQIGKRRNVVLLILVGSFTGPVLGVTASLFAVQHSEVGIASTLMALPPVFLLPVSYFYFKERFGWQAIVGTLAAISGVGLLFLV